MCKILIKKCPVIRYFAADGIGGEDSIKSEQVKKLYDLTDLAADFSHG